MRVLISVFLLAIVSACGGIGKKGPDVDFIIIDCARAAGVEKPIKFSRTLGTATENIPIWSDETRVTPEQDAEINACVANRLSQGA